RSIFRGKPRRSSTAFVVFLSIVFQTWAFAAQNWYVGPGGNDNNPGTQSQPFRQIRKALTRVAPGDRVLVADGNYLGFDIDTISGTANAPILIQATGTNAVVQPTTDRSDNRDTILIVDSVHVIVDGFRSFNANRAALRIEGGDYITVRNCVFGNNATWGILTGHSPDLLIENNECYGSVAQHGIYVANSADRPVVRGNRCHDNYQCGIQLNADVNTPPGDGIITDALIENNVIYNNGAGGGGAINLDGVQDSIIQNNLLFTNHASGIILFQIDGAEGPRGNRILHNTIDMASNGRWALGLNQTTGTNHVRNNILYNRHSFRGGLEFNDITDANNTDSDYNVLNYITTDDGNSRLSLAQWQAQGNDLHSVTGTLAGLFIDSNNGNYLLVTNSPALDAALSLPDVLYDLDGNARPSGAAPDIGCYEMCPLTLRILAGAAAGSHRLQLWGGAGRTYELDASAALANWSSLATFVRTNRLPEWIVTSGPVQQFFRASYTP
ncbi:MAG TPA: right-handed parallel beta-helix repeat-containing protein, partial [Candidatus Nitrosotalea sp.]|nr:right-handed parallel beta-helix repeat-containing protein [Candidatus Nitrosotalea sp.]